MALNELLKAAVGDVFEKTGKRIAGCDDGNLPRIKIVSAGARLATVEAEPVNFDNRYGFGGGKRRIGKYALGANWAKVSK